MINKLEAEAILVKNGLQPGIDPNAIRAALHSANYPDSTINDVIMATNISNNAKRTAVDGLHKVFRSDQSFSPQEINDYLGIEVSLEQRDISSSSRHNNAISYNGLMVWTVSIVVAIGGLLFYMYMFKIGFFHPTVGLAFFNGS
jgi:hypothetical protein